jgi:REP element-mobilizing transposase RayT
MARPLRVEYPGACYHVVNRGNRRNQVFFSDSDYKLFLKKLAEYIELYEIELFAYCLMPNHYHLFLRTTHANLGRFMQAFNTSYTISMNRKHGESGHLFQGRYKAQLIETELYKNVLSRYIHLNPIKIKSLRNKLLPNLKKRLCDYKWSSFRFYLGIAQRPEWLNRSYILSSWGKGIDDKIKNYREYVEEGLLSDNSEQLSSNEISNIIGSDSFKDKIVRKYLKKGLKDIDSREQSSLAKINSFTVKEIINATRKYFELKSSDAIVIRKGANRDARKLAMFLSVKYCKKINSLAEIASCFKIGINGISSNTNKCKEELLTNKIFKKQVQELDRLLHQNTKTKV